MPTPSYATAATAAKPFAVIEAWEQYEERVPHQLIDLNQVDMAADDPDAGQVRAAREARKTLDAHNRDVRQWRSDCKLMKVYIREGYTYMLNQDYYKNI